MWPAFWMLPEVFQQPLPPPCRGLLSRQRMQHTCVLFAMLPTSLPSCPSPTSHPLHSLQNWIYGNWPQSGEIGELACRLR